MPSVQFPALSSSISFDSIPASCLVAVRAFISHYVIEKQISSTKEPRTDGRGFTYNIKKKNNSKSVLVFPSKTINLKVLLVETVLRDSLCADMAAQNSLHS